MALFTNFATLSYSGGERSSNTVTGEILETVSISKTAVTNEYAAGDTVSFAVTLVNSGAAPVTGLTLSDDLGAYALNAMTLYPLRYVADTLRLFVNGVLQPAPAVTAGPPLAVTGIEIPAGGSAVLVYETEVTAYAPLAPDSEITNTATVTGGGISTPLSASATVESLDRAELAISKALTPAAVPANGRLTYSFEIVNTGNTAAGAADNVILRDTFNPILTDLQVSLDGVAWAAGTQYSYDESTGVFSSSAGAMPVPAAGYTQNEDGTWALNPGRVMLVISGTLKTNS